jgi:hypothetical protein
MVFLGIYRAIYDYVPQGANELAISEGDLLFVLEKSTDDDWWKAKKKAQSENEEEPEGLIPNNYVEEVSVRRHCLRNEAYIRLLAEFTLESVPQIRWIVTEGRWVLAQLVAQDS